MASNNSFEDIAMNITIRWEQKGVFVIHEERTVALEARTFQEVFKLDRLPPGSGVLEIEATLSNGVTGSYRHEAYSNERWNEEISIIWTHDQRLDISQPMP